MDKKIGVGIIGLGSISAAHIQAINENNNLKLIGVANRSQPKAERISQEQNCIMYKSYIDLIKDDEVELVVMLTPPGQHEDLIISCAENKKHIFAEKPIGVNLDKINNYLSLCEERDVKVAVVSQHRFDNSTKFIKDKIASKALGNITLSNCIVNWYRRDEYYDSWHNKYELSGGGVLAIQAIHTIDLMLSFMGEVEMVKGFTSITRNKSLGVEDTAVACIKFANGALGIISATTSAYPGSPSKLEILGDQGTVTMTGEDITSYESVKDNEEYKDDSINNAENSFLDPGKISVESLGKQYIDVISAIKENKEPIVSGQTAKKTYEVIDAIYKSSETGQEIFMKNK